MKKFLLFLTIISICTSSASAQDSPTNGSGTDAYRTDLSSRYMQLVGEADQASAAAQWRRADSLLVAAMRSEPANPLNIMLMSNLGMIRFYQGNDSLALLTLDAANRMEPRAAIVLSNRAKVRVATGDTDGAIADWNSVLEIDSTNVATRYLRSIALLRRGDSNGAEKDAYWLRDNAPKDPRTDLAMGTLLSSTARYQEAIPYLNHSIETEPAAELYAARALCNLMTGNLNEASSDISEGMRLDPADGELYLYRALLNSMRYRPEDARTDASRAVELGVAPSRAQALLNN